VSDNVFPYRGSGWWSVFIVERRWVNHQFVVGFDNFDELLKVAQCRMDDI
jgi:hypothetical protein